MKELKYSVKAVTGIYCYLGISGNDDLSPLQSTDTEGLYTGTITLDQDSEYGVKFIINNDWAGSYGGYDGKLYYNANKGIYPVTTGTYDIKDSVRQTNARGDFHGAADYMNIRLHASLL